MRIICEASFRLALQRQEVFLLSSSKEKTWRSLHSGVRITIYKYCVALEMVVTLKLNEMKKIVNDETHVATDHFNDN